MDDTIIYIVTTYLFCFSLCVVLVVQNFDEHAYIIDSFRHFASNESRRERNERVMYAYVMRDTQKKLVDRMLGDAKLENDDASLKVLRFISLIILMNLTCSLFPHRLQSCGAQV